MGTMGHETCKPGKQSAAALMNDTELSLRIGTLECMVAWEAMDQCSLKVSCCHHHSANHHHDAAHHG